MSRSAATADRLARLTGLPVREARVVGAQHGYQHLMITLSGGRRAFAKSVPAPDPPDASAPGMVPDPSAPLRPPPDPSAPLTRPRPRPVRAP